MNGTMEYAEIMSRINSDSQQILQNYHAFFETSLALVKAPLEHASNADKIIKLGKISTLKYFKNHNPKAATILIIPSMINKSDILDITPSRSLCLFFKEIANVYLIDWNNPTSDYSLNAYLEDIKTYISLIYSQHKKQISLIGYCLGGNLACAAYFCSKNMIHNITLIATPWDFSELQYRAYLPATLNIDYIPSSYLTFYFNSLNLDKIIKKYTKFRTLNLGQDELELFIKVEQWANNGINLPLSIARTIASEFFQQNKTRRRCWIINHEIIDPKLMHIPVMVVSTDNDRIVSKKSAESITLDLPHPYLVSTQHGHVGIIISKHSRQCVWPSIGRFLLSNVTNCTILK